MLCVGAGGWVVCLHYVIGGGRLTHACAACNGSVVRSIDCRKSARLVLLPILRWLCATCPCTAYHFRLAALWCTRLTSGCTGQMAQWKSYVSRALSSCPAYSSWWPQRCRLAVMQPVHQRRHLAAASSAQLPLLGAPHPLDTDRLLCPRWRRIVSGRSVAAASAPAAESDPATLLPAAAMPRSPRQPHRPHPLEPGGQRHD